MPKFVVKLPGTDAVRTTEYPIGHISIVLLTVANGHALRPWLIVNRRLTPDLEDAARAVGALLVCTPGSSSMTTGVLRKHLVSELDLYRQQYLKADTPLFLIMDGHASRKDCTLAKVR